MDGLRAGKYAFQLASIAVSILILLIVAAPILGVVTPQVSPHDELGVGLDLSSVQSQLQKVFSSTASMENGSTISVPAFNRWLFPAAVSLSLSLSVNGTTVYQTQKATLPLAPYHSGLLNLTVALTPGEVSQLQGQQITGGGVMTLQEGQFWTITVNLGGRS